jgi:Xaa-Pro aminopeptidase
MNFTPNIDALKGAAQAAGLDAIIAMSPENFTYGAGSYILTVKHIRPRQAFAVFPAQGEPFAVICKIEESLTRSETWIKDIHTYIEFTDYPIDSLVEALTSAGLIKGRFGIDLDYIPAESYLHLTQKLPGVAFVNSSEIIAAIRAVKGTGEIDIMEAASRQTHQAVLDAMATSKLGDNERQMADRIANNIINYGADGTLFMCFASGERSPQSHAHADPKVIPKEGEIIRFDVGGCYGPFASDFARTYSAGAPSAMQKQVYRTLIECQEETINSVKPGMFAEDLFFICKDAYAKRGLPFYFPHIGHSFGIELHESPMLRPGVKTPLVPGMIINIEPIAKDEEGSLYHTEDLVLVTETGFRLLTLGLAPKELPVIGQTITY